MAWSDCDPPVSDPERQATRALDLLRRTPVLWGSMPVLLYGFDDFTRLQLDAIETLGVVVGAPVTVSLTYEPGRAAFASRGDTFQRLLPLAAEHLSLPPRAEHYAPGARAALHHLERHIFEPDVPAPIPTGEALRLLEGGGERAELELVAEAIHGLLERGVQPGEIAVAHRSPERVAELLGEVFRARGIPFVLRRRLSLMHTATGRALLGLLKATFPDATDDGGGLGDLLAWLRAPGVASGPELVDELEWRARRAGVSSAARARALWEAEHGPLETLEELGKAARRSRAALIERTIAELARLGFAPQAPTVDAAGSPAPGEEHAAQLPSPARSRHPTRTSPEPARLVEARALAVGQEALEELRELASSAPQLAPDPHELIELLQRLELVVGEDIGEAAGVESATLQTVAVLDPLALRARRVRALFLCGLQEGLFPAPARAEPYLSEEERRGLAEASGLRLGRPGDALAAERYLLYAAISRPLELLVLSWHTSDDDGLPAARSLFVDDICDLFAEDLHQTPPRRALGEVSSYAPTESDARPEEGIRPLRDPRVLADLGGQRLWSASGLQSWAGCPVQWFVERMLGARDLEPEAEPLARGGLAHAALHQTLKRLREETGSARLTTERLTRARELLRAALQEHERGHRLSTVPERVPGIRRRLQADLERYLEHAAECGDRADVGQLDLAQQYSPSQLEPTYLELPFGFPAERVAQSAEGRLADDLDPTRPRAEGECPPASAGLLFSEQPREMPPLDLGEGVLVRGFIDRVDVAPGGEAVVYDYKSGSPAPPDRWLGERNFQIALYTRAVEQLLGARVAGGFYQPLSGRDLRARGVLADGEGVALECVRGDVRPAAEVRELVDAILAAARTAAAEARAGQLESRPATCGFGGSGCMYPSICRCDR